MVDLFALAGVEKPNEVEKVKKERIRRVKPEKRPEISFSEPEKEPEKPKRKLKGKDLIVDLPIIQSRIDRNRLFGVRKTLEFKYKEAVLEAKRIHLESVLTKNKPLTNRFRALTARIEYIEIGKNDNCETYLRLF